VAVVSPSRGPNHSHIAEYERMAAGKVRQRGSTQIVQSGALGASFMIGGS
jgi:hypothetical protein